MTGNYQYIMARDRVAALSDARTSSTAGKEPACSTV